MVKGKSSGVPRSAVQQALQTEFPLQAEFDAFGTRVEGLALELARGLVAAKEETAESAKIALAERDAQIAERDARIAELINSMNGDISRRESTTGSANPARCNRAPASATSATGEVCGLVPPVVSASASRNARRNSINVSPPSIAARNRPSGFKARRICTSAPGRSLTQCSARPDRTRSRP